MEEFMSPALTSATAYHEAYLTFIAAGFTPEQAFELLLKMLDLAHR